MKHAIPRHVAQSALAQQMLIDHGRDRTSEPFLLHGRMYRITIELIPFEDVPSTCQEFLNDHD
ncbi:MULTISPECIES: hypothetical protein [Halomonadaceae]|uniref:hypothetical protein n=1 Tax=Halomonadaceae TaxID=28256 RepID=UPI0015980EB3|nr:MULTISPECIES: hypothetical protein [Halomonas]QJQ93944.1 hypothetical protein HIO72_00620 [Halomonas sp. PA5]